MGAVSSPQPPTTTTLVPAGLLTGGQLPLQCLQLQGLGGLGQLADLPALLVDEVDGDGLAGDQQGHQDGERGEGGFAAQRGPAARGEGAQPPAAGDVLHPAVTAPPKTPPAAHVTPPTPLLLGVCSQTNANSPVAACRSEISA